MPSENVLTRTFGANAFAIGEVVHVTANKTVARAQADVAANVAGALGLAQGWTTVFGGVHPVLLEAGLVGVAAGQTLYVSATQPGRATNVAPGLAVPIGTVFDAAGYATTNLVVAVCNLSAGAGGGGPGGLKGGVGYSFFSDGFEDWDHAPDGVNAVRAGSLDFDRVAAVFGTPTFDVLFEGACMQTGTGAIGDQGVAYAFISPPSVPVPFTENASIGGPLLGTVPVTALRWTDFKVQALALPMLVGRRYVQLVLTHDQPDLTRLRYTGIRDWRITILPGGSL